MEMRMGALLVAAEAMDVGCNTLSKAAMSRGMNNFVFVVYSHALGSLFLLPSSFCFHRKVSPPPINSSIVLRLFLLGFVSYCCALFLFIGVGQSSPTLASALNNLSPAFTFIFAIFFRMEALDLRNGTSLYKFIGTIVSISGALTLIFYQGIPIAFYHPSHLTSPAFLGSKWVVGGFFCAASSAWVLRDYPSELLVALISCSFETLVAVLVAMVASRNNMDAWKLKPDLELISIFFAAILIVGMLNFVQSWACRKKGPVYVSMFKPLQMIIAVFLGVTLLGDTLHLGSVIGGLTIAFGFYTVMKGKAMEEMTKEEDVTNCQYEEAPDRAPLLTKRFHKCTEDTIATNLSAQAEESFT
ncbi:hypothetical protein V2J09_015419 [Rumex salicifolius]